MKLETLYKRAKTGKIQYWSVMVEEDGETFNHVIAKESGQLGTTNPVHHRETISNGKQNRSALQQAEFQAESDWKKKLDSGYKTLAQLEELAKEKGII